MSTQMQKTEQKLLNSDLISQLVQQAIAANSPIETLKELMAMKERWETNEARKAYHVAMAEFKKHAPKIEKDKRVSYDTNKGKMSYTHATLGNITNKINCVLSEHGFSASWIPKIDASLVTVTCRITHKEGHSEDVTLSGPIDSGGLKNGMQAIASTLTYLERYTLLAATGLAPENDEDNDGAGAESTEKITPEQVEELKKMIAAKGGEGVMEKFLIYMAVNDLQSIEKGQYQKAVNVLSYKK